MDVKQAAMRKSRPRKPNGRGDGRIHVLLAHQTIIEGHFREVFDRHRAIFLQDIGVRDSTCDVR
jgi:hypothetical protein